ncbi:hypothetical protein [Streptomyces brasiliscabiei]|uniref:hypothetical protein n=1 Tax=Streptomyces brasiliscabiei TaxID=2736302 RepID=UPI001C128676|nr:hypothetical protein [Streptomyces brasiliscabiei]
MAVDRRVVVGVAQVHPHGSDAAVDQGLDAYAAGFVVGVADEVGNDAVDQVPACVDPCLELGGYAVYDVDRRLVELDEWWCSRGRGGHTGPLEGDGEGSDRVRAHHLAESLAEFVRDALTYRVGDLARGGFPVGAGHFLENAQGAGHGGGDASVEEGLLHTYVDPVLTGGVNVLRSAGLADDGHDVRATPGLSEADFPGLFPRPCGEVAEVALSANRRGGGGHTQALRGDEEFVSGLQGDGSVAEGGVGGLKVGDVVEHGGDRVLDRSDVA